MGSESSVLLWWIFYLLMKIKVCSCSQCRGAKNKRKNRKSKKKIKKYLNKLRRKGLNKYYNYYWA